MNRLSAAFLALACTTTALAAHPPHLDLEMTSGEYRAHLAKVEHAKKKLGGKLEVAEDPAITSTLKLGVRLQNWISKVNAVRSPESAIRLTSATTRTGIPIDKPNMYSPSIIKQKVTDALTAMPEEMRTIITGTAELPETIPVDDETFVKLARPLDRQYQSAARFKSLDGWRSHYAARAKQDVRGLYYLNTNKITAEELASPETLPAEKLADIKEALVKVCYNTLGTKLEDCRRELEKAFKMNTVDAFYNRYVPGAKEIWNNFFVIPSYAVRTDVVWAKGEMTVPFITPSIAKFVPYLQNNIEDEFKWKGWNMRMNFGDYSSGPRLIFKPGVVPHVNGLGGDEIVMDSNQPIEEYESQWTIRHEFGHVIGLPDCYHEFYDTNLKAYVNYQLDVTDLMCSRAGNMNERIYHELEKAYKK